MARAFGPWPILGTALAMAHAVPWDSTGEIMTAVRKGRVELGARRSVAFHRAMAAVESHGRSRGAASPLTPGARMLAEGMRAGQVDRDTAKRIYRAIILAWDR